jgi:hypothetical protein
MSIYKVNQTDFQSITVATNPSRYYSSSSSGVTGSVHVFARRSKIEKETAPLSSFIEATHNDVDIASTIQGIKQQIKSKKNSTTGSIDVKNAVDSFLNFVNDQGVSAKKKKVLDVIRFTPSFNFTSNTVRKMVIKENLSSYYRGAYPSSHWAYVNYNSLNFFSSSDIPSSSVLLYPNYDNGTIHEGYSYGAYMPSGAISFDFYINPKYNNIDEGFKAGTIFHLSSTYALSLVSGSLKDGRGRPLGFKMLLQLSHSADIPPSLATQGSYPNNLVFESQDNALTFNKWHHVVVRWGTSEINVGTGSFNVDGVDKGYFVVPSGTIAPLVFPDNGTDPTNPDVLCIGNYYEGSNSGFNTLKSFFARDTSNREGLLELDPATGVDEPDKYAFNHPLRAEVHDLSIKKYYMSEADLRASSSIGPSSIDPRVAFYVPPFFVEATPVRKFVNTWGGILQTPFIEVDGTTADPFNIAMAFGVAGHYINTENFLKDFATNNFPRQHHLSASALNSTTTARSANEFLYDQPMVRKRNLLIMPCDDGNFYPDYDLLKNEELQNLYSDDLDNFTPGFISLNNMLLTSSLVFNTSFEDSEQTNKENKDPDFFIKETIGVTPENPASPGGPAYKNYLRNTNNSIYAGQSGQGLQENAPLTIYQRTGDASSNQVTFFDISNLYYGMSILPGSFMIRDVSLSGSNGEVKVTIKDNGNGGLYRADSDSTTCKWNSVGTIFYNEGIIAIKSPHLYFFGKENFEVSFKGEQNIHVLKLDVVAPVNHLNSSSNPTFIKVPSTLKPNEYDSDFVYISGINFHDDNLNVIMKTQLAQPTMKRHSDKIAFRVKYDW